MSGSSIRNLDMFKALCGEDVYKHVVLATTMWGNLTGPGLSYDVGVEREQELLLRPDWWGLMYKRGSQVVRHTGDRKSALEIVDYLVSLAKPVRLTIQRQLVDEDMLLEDTDAGQKYEKELNHLKKLHQGQLRQIKDGYEQAIKDRDTELAEILEQQRRDLEGKLKAAAEKQDELKVNLEQLAQEKADQFNRLLGTLEEEQQKTAKLVADREADLKRFEDEREKDRISRQETEDRYKRDREALEDKLKGLEKEHKENSNAAINHRDSLLKLEVLQNTLTAKRKTEDGEAIRRQEHLQRQIQDAQAAREAREQEIAQARKNSMHGVIYGLGTMWAGALTANVPMFIAGATGTIASALD
jgi:hypothetical protein